MTTVPFGRFHRLAGLLGEIDDRQPAVAKPNILSRGHPNTGSVGAAMCQSGRLHLKSPLQVRDRTAVNLYDASNSTHVLIFAFHLCSRLAAFAGTAELGVLEDGMRRRPAVNDPRYRRFSVSA